MKNYKQLLPLIAITILLGGCMDSNELPPACDLEPDAGPCEALIERYYFDQELGECKMFYWGGCDGVVPFETMEECKICVEGN